MVDFGKLQKEKKKTKILDPVELFRRMPKPAGINDLYTSQAQVLQEWFNRRNEKDLVLKLHTGGGKTLVGLLLGQSTLNEICEPVIYLVPTTQLVGQILEKSEEYRIPAVPYRSGYPLHEDFINSKAIMVATYKALFNGKSKFGVRGMQGTPQSVGAIIVDDAHVAFPIVRDSFTLIIEAANKRERYEDIASLFRKAFSDVGRVGTFDDVVEGAEQAVLEVPYWAWNEKIEAVREQLKAEAEDYPFVWSLLRDRLHLCHALISRRSITITPILPLVDLFPTFSESPRRIYMSATIYDDSEIVRTFEANPKSVETPLTSRSLAGISERMILAPDLMPFEINVRDAVEKIAVWAAKKKKVGSVVLVPSNAAAESWGETFIIAAGSIEVEACVRELQQGSSRGPYVFANRYDGIDLPADACRLLVLYGLPKGTSDFEMFRASALYGSAIVNRMLAQRIEQGTGRGARGAGDNCVVLLAGSDLSAWISKEANFKYLTSATRAQIEIGSSISKEIKDRKDLGQTINRSFNRDEEWVKYHAETLAELVEEESGDENNLLGQAAAERKAVRLWIDGYHEKAIASVNVFLNKSETMDKQTSGWLLQLAARIADDWDHAELAEDFQKQAFADNRNLSRPKVTPPYIPLLAPSDQARAIVNLIGSYRQRRGVIQAFEEVAAHLVHSASANQFEQALADLGKMLGFTTERPERSDSNGPDVLWLLPKKIGLVIEAKSRKKGKNALTKTEHGQLLVATEWFQENYPDHEAVRVSVHASNKATKAAAAGASHALTYGNLGELSGNVKALLKRLCSSEMTDEALLGLCQEQLNIFDLRYDRIIAKYLVPFEAK